MSEELARRLIEDQFPELAPVRVEPFGFGWDNTALLVNGTYVFRFPRRELGAKCLEAETRVLPRIASLVPLPIPAPLFVGRPSEAFRWPFAGYRLIEGRTACRAGLTDEERRRLAEPLASFLATLHAIPAAVHQAGADLIDRLNLERRVPMTRERLERLRQAGVVADLRTFEVIIEAAQGMERAGGAPAAPVLVHGDLYSRHLMIGNDRKLCGVIDWGDVHCGSAAVDLGIVHGFLPPSAHEAFRRAYGPIDARTWTLARYRAVDHSAAVVLYGHEAGDADLLREGLASLAWVSAGAF